MKELDIITNEVVQTNKKFFKILKKEIPLSKQPETLRSHISYDFFFKLPTTEDQHSLMEKNIVDMERHYWTKLTDLVFDLRFALSSEEEHVKSPYFIYLAETTPDQENSRESIKRELKRMGFRVCPENILPDTTDELKDSVIKYLDQSFLSIHIFGNTYGELLKNSEISAPDFQNKIAADYYENYKVRRKDNPFLFSRLIWMSPDLKIQNETQRHFIEQLKRDSEALRGASLIQTPLEYFKTIIMSEIKSVHHGPASESLQKRGTRIYLVHESPSFDKISDISIFLSTQGFEIIHSPKLTEEKNLLKKHRQNLVDCDAVLIYFDSSDEFWLKSKINDIVKAPGFGRAKPFITKAVYLDSPHSVPDEYFYNRGIIPIHGTNEFSIELLSVFIEKISIAFA